MNAIEKLQSERQRIVARLAELDKILGQYEELQRIAESYLAAGMPHTPTSDSGADSVAMPKPRGFVPNFSESVLLSERKRKTPMVDFEHVAIEVLSEADTPLDRSALYKALLDRDVVIGSPDESSDLNTLSARMSRMKEKVVNVSGYGYWPKGRAFLPGGYEPQGANDMQPLAASGDNNLV